MMVNNLNVVNIIFQGPQVAQSVQQIVTAVGSATTDCFGVNGGAPIPFGDADAQVIVNDLSTFVAVHQQLLATIIGKHGLLETFGFTSPVAAALRALESVVDTFAFALIGLIPTQHDMAMQQSSMLMASLKTSITVYSS